MKKIRMICILVTFLTAGAAYAQDVKLGFVYIMSGRVAGHGVTAKQGAELAIKELNEKGGILKRNVSAVFEDTKGDPETGLAAFNKLVNTDKVDATLGVTSSAVAAKVAEAAGKQKVPLIVTTAQTSAITGAACNKYVFRVTWNNDQALKAAALTAAQTSAKQWTTVGPDYALGHEAWSLFQKYLKAERKDAVFLPPDKQVFTPLTNEDWITPSKALAVSGAEGILVSLWGGNVVDFFKEGKKAKLFDGSKEIITITMSESELMAVGADMAEGIRVVTPYYYGAGSNEMNKQFVADYERAFGSPPTYQAQFAYAGVKAYAEAATAAGSTDKEAVVKALEGLIFEAPVGKITLRSEDHQAMFDAVAGKTGSKISLTAGKRAFRQLTDLIKLPGDRLLAPASETGCAMKR
jgi:branched-chain amino acid transport system substrate-binding protein